MIQIEKAFELARIRGYDVKRVELALLLWPESNERSRKVNRWKLFKGRTKSVTFDQVHIICEYLHTTPNFLFKL
jgi:hypothetical protein